MSDRKYYVFSGDNCRFEGMTSEQILNAIAEATGNTPQSIDDAVITSVKEQNKNKNIKIWAGTQEEYNAVSLDKDTLYLVSSAYGYLIAKGNLEADVNTKYRYVTQLIDGTDERVTAVQERITANENAIAERPTVELGINNGWRYEKHSNGVFRCYMTTTFEASSQPANGEVNTKSILLPIEFPNTNYSVNMTPTLNALLVGWYGVCNKTGANGKATYNITLSYKYVASNKYGVAFDIQIEGRWK